MVDLLRLNPEGKVELDKLWVYTVPELKTLISRDRGSEGDVGGARKKRAIADFTYIYHLVDIKSPYEGMPTEERVKKARECFVRVLKGPKVPEDDVELQKALVVYKEIYENQFKFLKILRALHLSVDKLEDYFSNVDFTMTVGNKFLYSTKDYAATVAELTNIYSNVIDLEEKLKMEMGSNEPVKGLRGGMRKGFAEDPGKLGNDSVEKGLFAEEEEDDNYIEL